MKWQGCQPLPPLCPEHRKERRQYHANDLLLHRLLASGSGPFRLFHRPSFPSPLPSFPSPLPPFPFPPPPFPFPVPSLSHFRRGPMFHPPLSWPHRLRAWRPSNPSPPGLLLPRSFFS